MSRAGLVVGVAAASASAAVLAGVTLAAFSATTSNPTSSFSTKRIYTGQRVTPAWQLEDAADGSAADGSWPTAFAGDGRTTTTTNWSTAYASNRYVDLDFNSPLAAGLSVSGATLNVDFAESGGGTTCFYFELRRASTGAVIGTHGGTGNDVGCSSSTTLSNVSTAISEVTTTDIANDLRVRIFGKNTGNRALTLDRVTVSGTAYGTFTLYGDLLTDAADTTPATTYWGIGAAGEGANYATGNWSTSFATGRYVKFTFPSYVPTGAVVAAATFEVSYRPNTNGNNACEYFEVYSSTTLIGTHGSSTTPISCNTSNSTYQTDPIPISEVDTVTEANTVVVKLYAKNSGSRPIQFDYAFLKLTYSLD